MPQIPRLDEFPYVAQEEDTLRCVPACVEMVLQYWGIDRSGEDIRDELGYSADVGTPFENIGRLSGVVAVPVRPGWELEAQLDLARPVIADVRVTEASVLGYAPADGVLLHAVVLVALDDEVATFFDPLSLTQKSTTEPQSCERSSFDAACFGGWVLIRG